MLDVLHIAALCSRATFNRTDVPEAASMIMLDDNFASTVHGIEEGRLIFVKVKKSIQYSISHSIPEVLPKLLYVIVPIPLPLSAILILVIDLNFELFAALRTRLPAWARSLVHTVTRPLFRTFWAELFKHTGAEVLVDGPLLSWAYLETGTLEAVGALVSFFIVLQRRGILPHDARVMQRGAGPPTNYSTKNAQPYNGIDASAQVDILAEAQSMYYWAVMTMQIARGSTGERTGEQ
ncbi:hypothetical protein SBRCBS47491_009865 [Sporothrix bragantina]|uniref:Uncharacterized protein n=1 Tax=Sporothrix bragantina TaxID=671064 RepID=A0ABP0CYA1_9PEZI